MTVDELQDDYKRSATFVTSPAGVGDGQASHLMAELRQAVRDLNAERAANARLEAEIKRLRGVEFDSQRRTGWLENVVKQARFAAEIAKGNAELAEARAARLQAELDELRRPAPAVEPIGEEE